MCVYSCQVIAYIKCGTECQSARFTSSRRTGPALQTIRQRKPFYACMKPVKFSRLRLPYSGVLPKAVFIASLTLYSSSSKFCSLSVSFNNMTNADRCYMVAATILDTGAVLRTVSASLAELTDHPLVKYTSILLLL